MKEVNPEELDSLDKSQLIALVRQLLQRVQELEARLGTDSQTSSQPHSSDGLKKKKSGSLRAKSDRKPGGQPGHKET